MSAISEGPAFDLSSSGYASTSDALGGKCPTQEQLAHFVTSHGDKIITMAIEADDLEESSTLDFRSLSLPKLQHLHIANCQVQSLVFTSTNIPALNTLVLSTLQAPHGTPLRFELDLPELETLNIECIIVNGPCNLGLSLSRSPKLESFTAYKFRYLSGHNCCVLPKCQTFNLTRSECTNSLEILQAPCLERLSIGASYDMHTLRLWDFPYVMDTSDVEKLESELEAGATNIREQVLAVREKWKNGTYGGSDAYKKRWIEKDEISGFNFENHPYVEELLEEQLEADFQKRYQKRRKIVWNRFVEDLSERSVVSPKGSLPVCQINHANVDLNEESMCHLRANKRVELDDEYDEWF